MPITYRQDHDRIDLIVRFEGTIRPEDISQYFDEVTQKIGSFEGTRVLMEVDQVRIRGFSFASVSALARRTRRQAELLDGSRTAIVASQAVAFGVVRMYIGIRDPNYAFSVFRNRDEATRWLLADRA